jgi:hypothetical protein
MPRFSIYQKASFAIVYLQDKNPLFPDYKITDYSTYKYTDSKYEIKVYDFILRLTLGGAKLVLLD